MFYLLYEQRSPSNDQTLKILIKLFEGSMKLVDTELPPAILTFFKRNGGRLGQIIELTTADKTKVIGNGRGRKIRTSSSNRKRFIHR